MKFMKNSFNFLLRSSVRINCRLSSTQWQKPSGNDTGIRVYNCIEKKKVPLIIKNNQATWYSCGPTVYDTAHIGHASCYVKLDIIQKILTGYFHIKLVTSMGITDVDDKIIKRSQELQKKPEEIAVQYEKEFWKNLSDLGVAMPQIVTRVTEHIPTIKKFIAKIMKNYLCYIGPDNSIYFDTKKFGYYGKLQSVQQDEEVDAFHKKSKADFALWKCHKPGEPYWETEWGNGRPGWHIECSAMASRLFGKSVDFHAGGIDLRFPHHENEEAQSCAYHGHNQWVNYWLHPGHLHIKGDVKMSKSLKNTVSIDDLLKYHSPTTFRMACLLSHYTHPMEYCEDLMKNSKAIIAKFKYFVQECAEYMNNCYSSAFIDEKILYSELEKTKLNVDLALRDDFDTANCVSHLLALTYTTTKMLKSDANNKHMREFKPVCVGLVSQYIQSIMDCFGITLDKNKIESTRTLPDIIDVLVKFRHSVRTQALTNKEIILLKECDSVRNVLQKYNVKINDKPGSDSTWIYAE